MLFDPGRVQPRRALPWWVASTMLALLVLGLGIAVVAPWAPLIRLDHRIAQDAYDVAYGHPGLDDALTVVAIVGSPDLLRLLLALTAGLLAWRRSWGLSIWLVVITVVEAALSPLLKVLVDRPRPSWAHPVATVSGYSFPSGHAAGAGLFAAAAVLLTMSATTSRVARVVLAAGWVLVAAAIGLDRIFLGVHFASDVVAGWLLGAAVALVGWVLIVVTRAPALPPVEDVPAGPRPGFAVIANPLRVLDMPRFRAGVAAAADRWGWAPPLWLETTAEDPGVSMCRAALAADVAMVLVAGGDGTVRVVCAELAGTGVAVGLVPLGTGNLLVRNLNLPLREADAVEVALSGRDRAVDVVRVRGDGLPPTSFTVMAGVGLDAAIVAGAPDQLKSRMGWPAYVVSALRQLRHPAVLVEVSVDDQPLVRRRVRTVVVGNVGSLQGGIPLLPDALIDDGRLDVVVIAPQRTVGWLWLVLRVLRRARHTDERLDRRTGQRVRIRTDKPLLRQLDGDPVGEGTELDAEVLPGQLRVRVPR